MSQFAVIVACVVSGLVWKRTITQRSDLYVHTSLACTSVHGGLVSFLTFAKASLLNKEFPCNNKILFKDKLIELKGTIYYCVLLFELSETY